jgi:two-component system, LytTR family, sensor kinase
VLDYSFVLLAWSLASLGIQEWAARREAQHRATAAELAAREAELRMLRYQLNPHFLFNALNSIRATMPLDAPARDGVDALAGFLRYTLQASPLPHLRLEQEVEAARHYLAVEQLRFGERLRVRIDLDPRVAQVRVPGFLLHPLVENAVKHGMASGARPLLIGIHAAESDGHVRIEITNTVGERPSEAMGTADATGGTPGAGVGLENVRRRVPLYFHDRAHFSIAREDDLVRAVIVLDEERVH